MPSWHVETSEVEVGGEAQGRLERSGGGRGDSHQDPVVRGMAEQENAEIGCGQQVWWGAWSQVSLGSWERLSSALSLLIREQCPCTPRPGGPRRRMSTLGRLGEGNGVEAVKCTEMVPITPGEPGVRAPGGRR